MPLTRAKKNKQTLLQPVLTNLLHISQGNVTDDINKIQRGLYYVHLYSALEKITNDLVSRVLLIIGSFKVKYGHFISEFNTISLSSEMMAYKASAKENSWLKSHALFTTMSCFEESKIIDTFFAASLQNVWYETIQSVLNCFGITQLVDSDGSLKTALNEVVNNRNAVAHGRIPAEVIGERHRIDVLRSRTDSINTILDELITKFESYILNLEFVKPKYRNIYSSKLQELTRALPEQV